jgi:hypothetical protein
MYIQLLVFVKLAATCCRHGWDGTAARFDKYQKLCVQSELLMMGGGSTRNMESVIEINKLRKVTCCWLYTQSHKNPSPEFLFKSRTGSDVEVQLPS